MGPDSQMPVVRTIGNALFAWLLGALSRHSVGDTASGMRVLRRACLPDLEPLPDGLHFTPAMSARVLLEGKLRMVEIPMPYAERVGESKLRVLGDGLRFLRSIVQAAATFEPARPVLFVAAWVALAAILVGIGPVLFYLQHARLEEWMIYRLLVTSLLATACSIFICTAVVADRIAAIAHGRPPRDRGVTGALARLFTVRNRWVGGIGLTVGALIVVAPGLVEYATSGTVEMHWSRATLASLLLVLAIVLVVTTFLLNMMELIRAQRAETGLRPPPDRIHEPR